MKKLLALIGLPLPDADGKMEKPTWYFVWAIYSALVLGTFIVLYDGGIMGYVIYLAISHQQPSRVATQEFGVAKMSLNVSAVVLVSIMAFNFLRCVREAGKAEKAQENDAG
ncbi:MAG: hypothetical protein KGI60_03335 [Patescibacteria group bacterium]|nr:hypothetical protein [Patescibacteria group bacterium]